MMSSMVTPPVGATDLFDRVMDAPLQLGLAGAGGEIQIKAVHPDALGLNIGRLREAGGKRNRRQCERGGQQQGGVANATVHMGSPFKNWQGGGYTPLVKTL